ncbi:MAG: enoyl-CoA hydratase/isomerase family protein [Gammaproteobacteria bacterium]|nr:enoyl-CoA hydratase/isomerase family protein [Gammaproteobacteria bacterium]
MTTVVSVDITDGIATLTMNRPQALNAISLELATTLATTIARLDADENVKGMVLTGAGDRAFCAGVDLSEARQMTVERIESWFGTVCNIYKTILLTNKPFIAAINGIAAGGGFQMALVSDLRIGHAGSRMGQPEINAGIPSVMGAYWMSLHVSWSLNQDLSYTGRHMDAEECARHGLLNQLVERDELLPRARALASELAAKPRTAFLRTKQRFRELALSGFDDAFRVGVLGQQASYAAGEPQAIIDRFMNERAARKRR